MTFRQKSGWATIGALALAFGSYAVAVALRVLTVGVGRTEYLDLLVWAVVALVAVIAVAHIVLAVVDRPARADWVSTAARQPGWAILAAGAILAIGLTVTGVDGFWVAQTLIAALVAGEVASATTQIAAERTGARRG